MCICIFLLCMLCIDLYSECTKAVFQMVAVCKFQWYSFCKAQTVKLSNAFLYLISDVGILQMVCPMSGNKRAHWIVPSCLLCFLCVFFCLALEGMQNTLPHSHIYMTVLNIPYLHTFIPFSTPCFSFMCVKVQFKPEWVRATFYNNHMIHHIWIMLFMCQYNVQCIHCLFLSLSFPRVLSRCGVGEFWGRRGG